jgi:hypothetical protein
MQDVAAEALDLKWQCHLQNIASTASSRHTPRRLVYTDPVSNDKTQMQPCPFTWQVLTSLLMNDYSNEGLRVQHVTLLLRRASRQGS